jgi:hypothetical protein
MSEPTPDQAEAMATYMQGLRDMAESTGAHEGHTLTQVGRCVYCSCGSRYQGTIPKERRPA